MLNKSKKTYRSQVALVISLVLVITLMIVVYGIAAVDKFIKVDNNWREFSNEYTRTEQLLSQLRSNLGYGGVIHNFKNYIIRRDESLIPVVQKDIENCYKILNKYRLLGISDAEMDAVNILEGVIREYSNKLVIAEDLIQQDVNISELDKQVYVNDKPATAAIMFLVEQSLNRYQGKELETSNIISETKLFTYYGLIFIPIVFVFGFLFVRFLKQILDMNISLLYIRNELDDLLDGSPDATFVVNDKGEVVRANRRASELFGYNVSEILGLKVEELLPDEFRDNHVKLREAYMLEDGVKNLTPGRILEIKTKDGRILPVDISLSFHKRKDDNLVIVTVRDMSSYYEFEEAIKKERDFSNGIIETAQTIILVLDTKGCVVEFNPYMENMCGYKLSEVKGSDYFSIFLPQKDRDSIREIFLGAIDDIQTKGHVNELLTKDGGSRYIEWYDKTLKDKQGKTTGLLAVGQDVTERLNSQEVIRLQGAIAENMAEGVNIVRVKDGVLQYTNPKFDKMFGYDKGELIGKHVSILNSNEHNEADKVAGDIFRALNDKGYWHGEIKNVKKDGTVFWGEATVTCFKHSEYGEVFLSVQSDISQRKISEMELVKSESTVRALLNAPKDRLVLIDCDGVILALNTAEKESLQSKGDELVGDKYIDLLKSSEKSLILELVNYAKNEKLPINKHQKIDNQWIDVTVYPIFDAENFVAQLAVLISDISDLKLHEELRVIREKEHKDVLVREVHHRIKNNLQSVAGLLRRQGRKHPELQGYMSEATSQVESIAIIHGLQCTHNSTEHLEIDAVVSKITEAVKNLYSDKIIIEITNNLNSKYTIKSNEAVPFALVINELLTNSIKHCSTETECETFIDITEDDSKMVRISIRNKGELSSEFTIDGNNTVGSGLKLVQSLLPADYAQFNLYLDEEYVVADLVLDSKVLIND